MSSHYAGWCFVYSEQIIKVKFSQPLPLLFPSQCLAPARGTAGRDSGHCWCCWRQRLKVTDRSPESGGVRREAAPCSQVRPGSASSRSFAAAPGWSSAAGSRGAMQPARMVQRRDDLREFLFAFAQPPASSWALGTGGRLPGGRKGTDLCPLLLFQPGCLAV